MFINYLTDSRYREAIHSDFQFDYSTLPTYTATVSEVTEVPGGWLVTIIRASQISAGVAITSSFIPFPHKFVLKEKLTNKKPEPTEATSGGRSEPGGKPNKILDFLDTL